MTDTNANPAAFTFGGKQRRANKDGTRPAPFAKIERTVDFESLPEASKAFVIRYGITQYVADGAAGATNDAEFVEGIDTRITKLREADFSRTAGEPGATDDPEVLATAIAREEIGARIKAQKEKDPSFTLTKEQRAKAVEALRARDAERLVKEAAKRINDRKANASTAADFLAEFGI